MLRTSVLDAGLVDQWFEESLAGLRATLDAAAREVLDADRASAVVETVLAGVRAKLDNASSFKAWHEFEGKAQTSVSLNQLYQDVGGWDVVVKSVLEKMARALEDSERGLAILDDSSFRKHGKTMEGLSNVKCANIDAAVPGHNVVTLMLEDAAEGVFCDMRLKVNKSRPKNARRPGRLKGVVQQARDKTKRQLALEMLEDALDKGFDVRCVLFDAWYSCVDMAETLEALELLFISRAKSDRVFLVDGKELTCADLLARFASRRKQVSGTEHLFYQLKARLKNGIEVKLVLTWFFRGMTLHATVLVTTAVARPGVELPHTTRRLQRRAALPIRGHTTGSEMSLSDTTAKSVIEARSWRT
jgi:SRSO17 transposase